ncbi:MAG: hypothetical protein ABEJ61_08175 [Haloferacaceae archaeon]
MHMTTGNGVTTEDAAFDNHNRRPFQPTPEHVSRDRRDRIETDSGEYGFVPAFPSQSPARTTFYGLRRQLWRLHHARGHAYDDVGKTTVRNDYTARRCSAILQHCEVPDWAESVAIQRTLSEDLRGFNSHYAGTDGACIGFALLTCYDDPEKAQASHIAERAPSVVPGLHEDDVSGLTEYVFRQYGGES